MATLKRYWLKILIRSKRSAPDLYRCDHVRPKVTQAQSAVEQAQNNLANQTQTIAQRQADIVAAQAQVDQAQAQYQLSVDQLKRYQQLGDSGAVSRSERDQVAATAKNDLAALKKHKPTSKSPKKH